MMRQHEAPSTAPPQRSKLVSGQDLYVDARHGIAGDMLLAAAADLGAPVHAILARLRADAAIPEFDFELSSTTRRGIHCHQLRVTAHEKNPPHRGLGAITTLIGDCNESKRVRSSAIGVFREIAAAEATVHGTTIDRVHFHEVGAVDSIVDILGFAAVIEALDPRRVSCSSLPRGSGTVDIRHGRYPVPAPAALRLLHDITSHPFDVGREVATPTGIALMRVFADRFGPGEPGTIRATGFGAGTRVAPPEDPPNLLTLLTLDPAPATATEAVEPETLLVLETNVDTVDGEDLGALSESLLAAGAVDVFYIPTMQKKSRPGHLVTVLCAPRAGAELRERLFRETGTLGIRSRTVDRHALDRRWLDVEVSGQAVRVKLGYLGDEVVSTRPEFEDLRVASQRSGMSIRELRRQVALAVEEVCRRP